MQHPQMLGKIDPDTFIEDLKNVIWGAMFYDTTETPIRISDARVVNGKIKIWAENGQKFDITCRER